MPSSLATVRREHAAILSLPLIFKFWCYAPMFLHSLAKLVAAPLLLLDGEQGDAFHAEFLGGA